MEIEKDKFVLISRKGNVAQFVYVPSNYPGPLALDATINQPERSKREDGINTLRCGNCEKEFDIFLDPNHAYRCGALNSMET